ncbi:ArsR family transcriptional regulator [Bosea sp. WAO]|uniref:sulfite-sensing transcriptional repressor BigR n=1 Tax=Bosea sp. WAO TaxID=406341 RepID=UPI0007480576|nr:sulfite-sensing transcriptional repressor BigR [Bosea sp. WAO]KUL92958.1 ArsR family transcriptional regulator [Bosea sp. WAO]
MTMPAEQMNARAELAARAGEVAELLRTLANRNRLMLVCTLVEGEYSVGQLEEMLGIRQPTLSQQLTVLREAGLVETRRDAKQIFYRLTAAKAARLVEALHQIFCTEEAPV